MIKVKATVAYDGSGFHGFAVNDGVRTVAGDIESALAKITGAPVAITCAGRTDKGVHGHGQVISFDVDDSVDPGRIERSVNQLCRPSIVLRDTAEVDASFDARFSATWRRYRYRVLAQPRPDPLLHGQVWHVTHELDLEAMNRALAILLERMISHRSVGGPRLHLRTGGLVGARLCSRPSGLRDRMMVSTNSGILGAGHVVLSSDGSIVRWYISRCGLRQD